MPAANIAEAEELCRRIYSETRAFYRQCEPSLPNPANYSILYGPPRLHPPVLFIGEQPGGHGADQPEEWLGQYPFADGWDMDVAVHQVWDNTLIQQSVALNVNFFHAGNGDEWGIVPIELRREIEQFCRSRAIEIIQTLGPGVVVAIGLKTFQQLAAGRHSLLPRTPERRRGRSNDLIVRGRFRQDESLPVVGVVHLTGGRPRPNNDEFTLIHDYFATNDWQQAD